ncbi:MAG: hypothetical protein IKJ99_01990 [Oscillospiraceae bacterium]|nr:hypothetical protein [Oscillospiraceae bacterium]
MKRITLLMALCLLLSGCSSWMDGSHLTVTPHQEQIPNVQTAAVSAADYDELRGVMEKIVESGAESGVINVAEYDPEQLELGIRLAAGYVQNQFPLGVYAIENLQYEIGSGGGQPAISVSISYIHGRSEIRKIQEVDDMNEAQAAIEEALEECAEGVVLLIDDYGETDLVQLVEDFADQNPDVVMEVPQVAVGVYPDSGLSRVVELKFTYQSSRDALRQMQSQVERVFTSAVLYTSSDAAEARKYTQLYTFLMERFDYKLETSITPSYSLLCHGVGDSKAFATAYAAMCRMAELECLVVSGTREGEPWYWNLILEDGVYYHVDLLRSSEMRSLQRLTDDEMEGYVWDYSAYPEA